MSVQRVRALLIGLIAVAAVLNLFATREHSRLLGGASVLVFLAAVMLYAYWRRVVRQSRAGRVFDREAKTDETRTRTDQ
jgi:inner membrane protein involved in colicin E2 resistance